MINISPVYPLRQIMNWIGYSVIGLVCVGLWAWSIIYFLRSRSAFLDLLEEVNAKLPYVMRYSIYSMKLIPFRVWRKHREFYPQDTGVRYRVKYYGAVYLILVVVFTSIILVSVFVGH